MTNKDVLVTGVQRSKSVIPIPVYILIEIISPFWLLQTIELGMLYSRSLLVSYFKYICVFSHFCHDPVGWSLPDSSVHGMGSPFYFYFFSFIYLFIYSIVVVLPYIDMNPPWVYMCSPS